MYCINLPLCTNHLKCPLPSFPSLGRQQENSLLAATVNALQLSQCLNPTLNLCRSALLKRTDHHIIRSSLIDWSPIARRSQYFFDSPSHLRQHRNYLNWLTDSDPRSHQLNRFVHSLAIHWTVAPPGHSPLWRNHPYHRLLGRRLDSRHRF